MVEATTHTTIPTTNPNPVDMDTTSTTTTTTTTTSGATAKGPPSRTNSCLAWPA